MRSRPVWDGRCIPRPVGTRERRGVDLGRRGHGGMVRPGSGEAVKRRNRAVPRGSAGRIQPRRSAAPEPPCSVGRNSVAGKRLKTAPNGLCFVFGSARRNWPGLAAANRPAALLSERPGGPIPGRVDEGAIGAEGEDVEAVWSPRACGRIRGERGIQRLPWLPAGRFVPRVHQRSVPPSGEQVDAIRSPGTGRRVPDQVPAERFPRMPRTPVPVAGPELLVPEDAEDLHLAGCPGCDRRRRSRLAPQ